MERLLSSSSNPAPSLKHFHLKLSTPFLPRLARFDSPNLNFLRSEFRRLNSLSCKSQHSSHQPSSLRSSFSSSSSSPLPTPTLASFRAASSYGSPQEPEKIPFGASQKIKIKVLDDVLAVEIKGSKQHGWAFSNF